MHHLRRTWNTFWFSSKLPALHHSGPTRLYRRGGVSLRMLKVLQLKTADRDNKEHGDASAPFAGSLPGTEVDICSLIFMLVLLSAACDLVTAQTCSAQLPECVHTCLVSFDGVKEHLPGFQKKSKCLRSLSRQKTERCRAGSEPCDTGSSRQGAPKPEKCVLLKAFPCRPEKGFQRARADVPESGHTHL